MNAIERAIRDLQAYPLYVDWVSGDPYSRRTHAEWVKAFREFGFYRAGVAVPDAELPAELRLYRGSLEAFNRNLSWTPDLRVAQGHAATFGGKVWTALVPRSAILGAVHVSNAPDPKEYIVDVPEGVEVTAYGRQAA